MATSVDYPAAARVIALYLEEFCDESLPYTEMIAEAARRASNEIDAQRLSWQRVTGSITFSALKESSAAMLLWRHPQDLYPVVGCYVAGEWLLEEGGAEDRESRVYPEIGGGESWEPTHWCHLPLAPDNPEGPADIGSSHQHGIAPQDREFEAVLERKKGPRWRFAYDVEFPKVPAIYRTEHGTVYGLFFGGGKPVWIGRRVGKAWASVEREIRATVVYFKNGHYRWK